MSSALVGIVGVAMGAVFWGSNFVVCKGYDLPPDGMHFVLLMATGILFVGICTMAASQVENGDFEVVLAPDGLLGGAIWTCGNFLTVPIINNIGLGMGLAIWAGVNLIVAFVVGVAGMGDLLAPEHLSNPAMGVAGAALAVCALLVFSRVKPTLDEPGYREEQLLEPFVDTPRSPNNKSIPLGIALASVAGVCYGFQFVPVSVWNAKIDDAGKIFDHPKPSDLITALRFLFSQFVGIFLVSFLGFVVYTLRTGNKPLLVPREAILPSFLSGVLWAMGCAGGIMATSGLGSSVGFVLVLNLSFLVSSSWSILYYKEIQGKDNMRKFGAGFLLNIASSLLIALSS